MSNDETTVIYDCTCEQVLRPGEPAKITRNPFCPEHGYLMEDADEQLYISCEAVGATCALAERAIGELDEEEELAEESLGRSIGELIVSHSPKLALLVLVKLTAATAEHVCVSMERDEQAKEARGG